MIKAIGELLVGFVMAATQRVVALFFVVSIVQWVT